MICIGVSSQLFIVVEEGKTRRQGEGGKNLLVSLSSCLLVLAYHG
jgi:hypothetical protein